MKHRAKLQTTLEQRLAELVAMPTVVGEPPALKQSIATIAAELKTYGLHVHVHDSDTPWLIATTHVTKHPKILLGAHLDVVLPNDRTQYTMHIKDDNLYGRGVFDMKFAIACYLELAKQLHATRTTQQYDFGILITTDEEKGGYGGAKEFLQQGWRCDVAILPDGGRDWKVESKTKGIAYAYLDTPGKATHSSRPWEGVNATRALMQALTQIAATFPNDDPLKTTVSINTIESSGAGKYNVTQVPDIATAGMDIRAYSSDEINSALKTLKHIAKTHNSTLRITLNEPPVILPKNHPLVIAFLASLERIRGEDAGFVHSLGASDARHFAVFDIPSVLVYPHGGGAHSAQEYMKRTDLLVFFNVICDYIYNNAHTTT